MGKSASWGVISGSIPFHSLTIFKSFGDSNGIFHGCIWATLTTRLIPPGNLSFISKVWGWTETMVHLHQIPFQRPSDSRHAEESPFLLVNTHLERCIYYITYNVAHHHHHHGYSSWLIPIYTLEYFHDLLHMVQWFTFMVHHGATGRYPGCPLAQTLGLSWCARGRSPDKGNEAIISSQYG